MSNFENCKKVLNHSTLLCLLLVVLCMYLIKVDEVGVEDGDVVVGVVADVPQLLHHLGLVPAVEDTVALQHKPATHNLSPRLTVSLQ